MKYHKEHVSAFPNSPNIGKYYFLEVICFQGTILWLSMLSLSCVFLIQIFASRPWKGAQDGSSSRALVSTYKSLKKNLVPDFGLANYSHRGHFGCERVNERSLCLSLALCKPNFQINLKKFFKQSNMLPTTDKF